MFIKRYSFKYLFLALSTFAALGCSAGGGITNSSEAPTPPIPFVGVPTVASPSTNPHYSNASSVTISGMCMTGDTVMVIGASTDQTLCEDSSYSFTLDQPADGLYMFLISQAGPSGAVSNPTVFIWVRKTSISPPVILSPSSNPHRSAEATLSINGSCESGATVALSGDGAGQTTCLNSTFGFTLPKTIDGDYNLTVSQTDTAGNRASTSLVWNKHDIGVSPVDPIVVVAQNQPLTITGGSGTYTVSLQTNNSGGSYNAVTNTYTTGTVANVVDTLSIRDSVGTTKTYQIRTAPGVADHLVLPTVNGLGQVETIGRLLPLKLNVQVVDRYGNGVPNFQLQYQVVAGDAKIEGPAKFTSNASGLVEATLRMGYAHINNVVRVQPVSGTLPDLAGSGNPTLSLFETANFEGNANFGSIFSVGQNPGNSVLADFNEDGYTDIAVIHTGETSIGLLLGKGSGNFASMLRIQPLCAGPNHLALGDFNKDDHMDLVVACLGSDKVAILLGNGNGTFKTRTFIPMDPTETFPSAVAPGDFNADGKLDLAVTAAGGSTVGVRFGVGDGTFLEPTLFSVGQSPLGILAGDLDKDGKLDLIVSNSADNTIGLLINDGTGSFAPMDAIDTGLAPANMDLGDLNGDGWLDLVVIHSGDENVGTYLNNTRGYLQSVANTTVGSGPAALSLIDFNNDSKLDLIVANSGDGALSVLAGAGNGSFIPDSPLAVITNPVGLMAGDANGDGWIDLIVSGAGSQELQIIPGQPSGNLGFTTDVGIAPVAAAYADFDLDGKMDSVVANSGSNTLAVLKGSGNGLFTPGEVLTTGAIPTGVVAEDFNRDGYPDIAVVSQTANSLRIFLNKKDGTFDLPNDLGTGVGPRGLLARDLNGDTYLDIAVVNGSNNTVSVFLGIGNGAFAERKDFLAGSMPNGIDVGDLNGDQKLDLVVANRSSASVSVLINNGNGNFQEHITYPCGASPVSIVAADFNRDNLIDVATTNEIDGTVSILMGNGDGSLRPEVPFSAGSNPTGLILGDFNSDNRLDLGVANSQDSTFTVLIGAGNGAFNTTKTISTNFAPNGLSSIDLNGDGVIDIGVFDLTHGSFRVWLGY